LSKDGDKKKNTAPSQESGKVVQIALHKTKKHEDFDNYLK